VKAGDLVRWTLPDAFDQWRNDVGVIVRLVPVDAADVAWISGHVAWTPVAELEVISESR
tara:strand:- start:271 stop:447 length:177 start_codon:yes stop_codon:yes gene_type:complete